MTYTVKLMDGAKLVITEDEFKKLDGKSGLIFIPSLGQVVNLSSVTRIAPTEVLQEKQDFTHGVLHDGSRAVKQFGRWFDPNGAMDEKGHYLVAYDSVYYPEVAKDLVVSVDTWEREYKSLGVEERKTKMLGTGGEQREKQVGFVPLKEII